jgi:hypothetical protein|mmetsp:Transcript_28521/g.38040  ORF Transcript_28521/g.38040 Transcript_28521/m.38040 type:complete len:177 (-) Transcript_28521:2393-2923(-)
MFYLDAVEPGNNEVLGSALMEENQKERDLQDQRQLEQREMKEEYDRRIEEITSDYRMKLRDLDVNYADKKRELDHERYELQRQISTAQTNFDNREFGIQGEPLPLSLADELGEFGINSGEDRLRRIEPLHVIEPYDVEDIEEAPVLASELANFEVRPPASHPLPGMVEMEASLIPG